MRKTGRQMIGQTFVYMKSMRFWLAVLLFLFTCLLSEVSYYDGMQYQNDSILELLFSRKWEAQMYENTAFSSYEILCNYDSSMWFSLLIICIFSFPSVSAFMEEYYSGEYYFMISRMSVKAYSLMKFIAAGLTGMGVCLFGYLMFAGLVVLRFPNVRNYPEEYLAQNGIDLVRLFWQWANLLLTAALISMFVLFVASFVRDMYFVFGLPMLCSYLIFHIEVSVYRRNPDGMGLWHAVWGLVNLPRYSKLYLMFESLTGAALIWFYLLLLLEICAMFAVFFHVVKRRCRKNV